MSITSITGVVATGRRVLYLQPEHGSVVEAQGLEGQLPTSLAADPTSPGRLWCGTVKGGVFCSEDRGATWHPSGLPGRQVTALAPGSAGAEIVWAGTEPSAVWRGRLGGQTWERTGDLMRLPSSYDWAFPPKPETHHVRWIAPHPHESGTLWVAIEAGALIRTDDGGATWSDRVPGGPTDTHELAIHPLRPDSLRSAAGDGFFESEDGGRTWTTVREGLEVEYFRSVAIDPGRPEVLVASASSRARTAYMAGHADGRVYRRTGRGPWERPRTGWPNPPSTIAPLLRSGFQTGEFWAADERGLHHSANGGERWEQVVSFPSDTGNLRGLVLVPHGSAGKGGRDR